MSLPLFVIRHPSEPSRYFGRLGGGNGRPAWVGAGSDLLFWPTAEAAESAARQLPDKILPAGARDAVVIAAAHLSHPDGIRIDHPVLEGGAA